MDFQNIAFSIVLFVVYMACVSLLVGNEVEIEIANSTSDRNDENVSFSNMFEKIEESEKFKEYDSKAKEEIRIDLDTLTLRKARKVAKALGIRQKVNGKDQPKKWLIAQIKQRVLVEPKDIMKIQEVLAA